MVRLSRRRFLVSTLASALVLSAAGAQAFTPSGSDTVWVKRIEDYLNAITTLRARFLQAASNGDIAKGTFYMRRPGRLRIQYDPPSPVLILADGHRLIYVDKELESLNMVPIEDTLAAFLVRPHIDFKGDVAITGFSHAKGTLRVTLTHAREANGGQLTLVFDDNPLRLRLWVVNDAQGTETRVALSDTEFGAALGDELFETPANLKDPAR